MDFCGQGFVQPRGLTETGLRINLNKRIKLGGVGGDVCIAHYLAKFSDFSCALMGGVLICNFFAALADGFRGKMRILLLGNKSKCQINVCSVFI